MSFPRRRDREAATGVPYLQADQRIQAFIGAIHILESLNLIKILFQRSYNFAGGNNVGSHRRGLHDP
jgi:hypothetical protein